MAEPEPTPDRSRDLAEEQRLLAALRRGEPSAFDTLVRRYSPALLQVARRILRHEEDAREALQDGFTSAFKALPRFDGDARIGTWLHRIAVNAALMKLRTRRRHPEKPIDDLLPRFSEDGHELAPSGPWTVSAGELAAEKEARAFVRRMIDELPESYRVVLTLRDLEELSTEETARLLEATPNAVKIRLHRARQALRAKLDQRWRTSSIP
jgi:RNA polymerase sigma-70 factor (ECF subfamily)